MSLVDLIVDVAKVPSFSTYEERLHPYVLEYLGDIKGVNIVEIKDNNLLVIIGGENPGKPVAITSHLDKINHFGEQFPAELGVNVTDTEILGQMDNAVGVGVCLQLAKMAEIHDFPPLYLLFSEMEESTGLRHHPHLLKNHGKDVGPQIGANRLSEYLKAHLPLPAAFITVDTTPVFKGDSGVALYTEYWEKTGNEPNSATSSQNLLYHTNPDSFSP